MLLDELVSQRDGVFPPAPVPTPTPAPHLTVDPVAVPTAGEISRRAARQRLIDLEQAARRNFRSAEEARRVLQEEHARLEHEATARTQAQQEADALRREVDRLRENAAQRAAQEETRAERLARKKIADEIKRFEQEHERVVQELDSMRGALSDHDTLLEEYAQQLRAEQQARMLLRGELDRAEGARSLAERSLEAATENARRRAEDDCIKLATTEQVLADAISDRERIATQVADLSAQDGTVGRLTAALDRSSTELASTQVRVADLEGRIGASEDAAQQAIAARDAAQAELRAARDRLAAAEQASAEGDQAAGAAGARIVELEASLAARVEEAQARAREAERMQGRLRREASDAAQARLAADDRRREVEAERDALGRQVSALEAELARARADGDRLRSHAVALGDELAASRNSVPELRAAAPAPAAPPPPEPTDDAETDAHADAHADDEATPGPPPLPLRIAGRHAPPAVAPPLERRRPARTEPRRETAAEHATNPAPVAPEPAAASTESKPQPDTGFRRSAMAELTAIASATDDFTYRRR